MERLVILCLDGNYLTAAINNVIDKKQCIDGRSKNTAG
jgi:hypothetical protein